MEHYYQERILTLIAKNLDGIADSDELFQLNVWIESSAENRKYYEEVKNIWDASDDKLDYINIDEQKAFEKIIKRINPMSSCKHLWHVWQKLTAILFLPLLLVGSMIWTSRDLGKWKKFSKDIVYNEIHAAYGTRSHVRLSDSTLVWLNSGSILKYPVQFDKNERKVYLSGEAYFEVKSDESKPFIVETPTLQIRATGTKFNINEYLDNPISEVTLLSGKVTVNEYNEQAKDYYLISELKPSQYLSCNKQTKEKYITNEDVFRYVAWKDGKLIFRNDPLDKVLSKLSVTFNVEIDLQGDKLRNYRYHATFQDESLEEILKLLKLSAPINFKEINRKPLPDGSFPKKKILVFPDN